MSETEAQVLQRKAAAFWESKPNEKEVESYARGCQLMLNMAKDGLPQHGLAMFIQSMINRGKKLSPAALGFIATADDLIREAADFMIVEDDLADLDDELMSSDEAEAILKGTITPQRRTLH